MAAVIFGPSDSFTQYCQHSDLFEWDRVRALSGAFFGVIATSWLHFWWGFLEGAVNTRIPTAQSKLANTLTKVFIDQALGAPLYIYSYYVITNVCPRRQAAATNETPWESLQHVRCKASGMLWGTMQQHWTIWPLVHSVNFYYVPLAHRVLVQNTVLIGWSAYLSHLNHNDSHLMTPDE